jgi:hypothetical protein
MLKNHLTQKLKLIQMSEFNHLINILTTTRLNHVYGWITNYNLEYWGVIILSCYDPKG